MAGGKLLIFDRDHIRTAKLKLVSGSWSSASKAGSDFSFICKSGSWFLALFQGLGRKANTTEREIILITLGNI